MAAKAELILLAITIVLHNLVNNACEAKSFSNKVQQERECDFLLRRLKRSTDNFIEDDDAFIENLIKSTINREKQKCMDKYHLLDTQRHMKQDGADDTKELRQEVAKLKDLVNVIKDQRYILRTLDNSAQKHTDGNENHHKINDGGTGDIFDIQDLDGLNETPASGDGVKTETANMVHEKLKKQQVEIANLKHLLQGVLLEMKTARKEGITTTEAPNPSKDMTKMLKELSLLEKKLSDLQQHTDKSASNSEVVGMKPPAKNFNGSIWMPLSQAPMQSRHALTSERAADAELDALLNLLVPAQTTSSVDTVLKSLDSDSDVELERRLQTLERQVKGRKKQQLEDKLRNLERELTPGTAQSKTNDVVVDDNAQLKHLLVNLLQKRNQETQSKSLGDNEILQELRTLQKNIRDLGANNDDDLLDDLQENNENFDITLERLINAGASSTTTPAPNTHKRRKLTPAQIKALRRRIKAMKQGNTNGGSATAGAGAVAGADADADADAASEPADAGNTESNHIDSNHGAHHNGRWFINPGHHDYGYGGSHSEHGYYGSYGPTSGGYGYDEYNPYGHGYGGNKYAHNFGNSEHFYGGPNGGPPSNQYGPPIYPPFATYPTVYPIYTSYQGNSAYSSPQIYSAPKPVSNSYPYSYGGAATSYQSVSGPNYKPFFPTPQEAPAGNYNPHPNSGTPSAIEPSPNPAAVNAYGPASVTELKQQIYDLQGIINSFNKPEYVQKPEDKATVYNLKQQINELKSVVNTLQEAPHGAQNEAAYHEPPAAAYEAPPQMHPEPVNQPHPPPPPSAVYPQPPPSAVYEQPPPSGGYAQPPPSAVYQQQPPPPPEAQPNEEYHQHPGGRRLDRHYRERRGIDIHSAIHRNQDTINTLGAFLGEFLGVYDDDNMASTTDSLYERTSPAQETTDPNVLHVFQDVNAKIAAVRNQLGHRMMQQHLQRPSQPLAVLPQWQHLPLPALNLRSNDYNAYGSHNYDDNYGHEKEKGTKIKLKIESKKTDLFDRILDKIISKLKRAFPKILELIFGSLEFADDYGDSNGYGGSYHGEDHDLIRTFQSMGLFGMLPMILVKFLSKIHYIFQYLQKYKFFKTFLVPAIVLGITAGAIVFLVYWMQPNEDYGYKQISYEGSNYRSSQSQPESYFSPQDSSTLRSYPLQPSAKRNSENLKRNENAQFQPIDNRQYDIRQ